MHAVLQALAWHALTAGELINEVWVVGVGGRSLSLGTGLLSADTPHPYRLQCEQSVLSALALALAEHDPAITVRRSFRATALTQDADGVTVTGADGEQVRAAWVVGCDGARSLVRDAAGFVFEGFTYPETTILATTPFAFEEHLAQLSNVNYCWSGHGTFSLLRLPTLWRCSLYADPDESIEAAITPPAIEAKLQRIVPQAAPYPVGDVRAYRIHQRIVEGYRRGRVLLAGDAAHLNSPSGGMGMNGGIHDAFALAEALGAVLRGADVERLDRYGRQRKAVAQDQILAQAHRNRTRMQERDPARRRAELARLQAICADPVACRAYLLKSSMIEGLREAETIA